MDKLTILRGATARNCISGENRQNKRCPLIEAAY